MATEPLDPLHQSEQLAVPEDVMQALDAGRTVEAIKLLRNSLGIGLKEAVDLIDAVEKGAPVTLKQTVGTGKPAQPRSVTQTILGIGCFLSFVWLFVSLAILAGNVIILLNLDGYRRADYQVTDSYYRSSTSGDATWGLLGSVAGRELRLADNTLLPEDTVRIPRELDRQYPAGTVLPVWYHPRVTGELFQGRTLNVLPATDDLAAVELARLQYWLMTRLLPFLGFLFASIIRSKTVTTVRRPA
jgi:hypothetical protein